MPAYRDRFEGPGEVNTIRVHYDKASSQDLAVYRFPSAGRVVGGYLIAVNAASGTNVVFAGIRNGGPAAVGTVQTAAQVGGTIVAGSVYSFTARTDGPEQFAAGDWLLLNVTCQNATPEIDVQIDYRLDQFPG